MAAKVHLYPVPVKTQGGKELELQLSPENNARHVRKLLLDAPETCFMTRYDLLLHTNEGSVHHLEDYNTIAEVADITSGGCFMKIVAALYDDQSIRDHVHRTRELLLMTSHSSLSTTLARQHKTNPLKDEVPELDNMGVMKIGTSSLTSLLASPSKEIKCVESIDFSSFNPPPSHRRLSGDLIYLDVTTLEGNKYCFTGTTKSFYVNFSRGNIFNPWPHIDASESTTIGGLLQQISPRFNEAFHEILERKASAHPLENEKVRSLLRPNTWLRLYPIPDHTRDAARSENSFTLSFGSKLIGMQRDWTKELVTCRNLPRATLQERILRDTGLYNVTSDFVDAATSGAIGVISRCIPPINPSDPKCSHMFFHNNILFTFAIDADLEQLAQKRLPEELRKVETTTPSNNYSIKNEEILPQAALRESTVHGSVIMNGTEVLSPDMPADAQLAESEQSTYASANNHLKGTKAIQEADVPGLHNLAMAIIDYRGHRVVAQSVLPRILQGDKSEDLLRYGSVDNGKEICWSEDFHAKVLEASKRLHLMEHSVLDGSGNFVKLAVPVECKGLVGRDDRHYLLDLMRVTPRDANYTGPTSRFCILRPELITAFCHDTRDGEDATKEILFNPNVFTGFKLAGIPEEIAVDEGNVQKASLYLKDVVLPKFIHDLCTFEVLPMDGQTLTESLHGHGINVRYIGQVAEGTRHMPHLWDLCSNEIVVRSAKHVIKDALRDTEDHDIGHAISHFFNCFAGKVQGVSAKEGQSRHHAPGKSSKAQAKIRSGRHMKKKQSLFLSFTSESLWADIQGFAKLKYKFELPEDARLQVKRISVMRNLCQKVGISIAARTYDFSAATPFQVSDILNLQPVVKHFIPVSLEAKDLVEDGKVRFAEGMLKDAYELFRRAYIILTQVTGSMHREVANCYRYMAMVLHLFGDNYAAARLKHKEIIINERCLGLDHPDTAHSYVNIGLFYLGLDRAVVALRHMSRALFLLNLSSGPDHPRVAATFVNVAMMYVYIGKMDAALRYLHEALEMNKRLLREEHVETAVCYHALAIAYSCMGNFELSCENEEKSYYILEKHVGDDSWTKDSMNWIQTFRKRQSRALLHKGHVLSPVSAHEDEQVYADLLNSFRAELVIGPSLVKKLRHNINTAELFF